MSRAVYSVRFQAVQGLDGSSASVVVPSGHTYVVKQVTLYMDPSLGVSRAFFEDDDSGAALFSGGTNIGTPAWFGFFGSLTFEEGQGFHFHTSVTPGDGVDVYAGGYDLTAT